MSDNNNERKEIRIQGVPPTVHSQIKNIAKWKGMDMSTFLRPEMRDIAAKYPEHIKNPHQEQP